MLTNRSMMSSAVIPELPYASVSEAAAWLERVFGFSVRVRIGDHRIQMNAGGGHVVLVEASAARGKASVMMRVADADGMRARIVAAGAEASEPQTQPYGERQFTAIDCGGHAWKFSQSVADVAPESWGGASGKL